MKKRLFSILSAAVLGLLAFDPASAEVTVPRPSSRWEVVKTIRVLNQNIFGREKAGCEDRFRAQAEYILKAQPAYDIISLNEHWRTNMGELLGISCDGDILSKPILRDPRYKGSDRSRLSYPKGPWYKIKNNGGNSIITSHEITDFKSYAFENSNDLPLSGYMLSRIELIPGRLTLDMWTTHLEASSDGCDDGCRKTQLRNLVDAIAKHSGPKHSGQSGNPVLVAGDFNIGGPTGLEILKAHQLDAETFPYEGNPGYDFLMNYFNNPRDLWIESLRQSRKRARLLGPTWDPDHNELNETGRFGSRIDFMFVPRSRAFQDSPYKIRLKSMNVVKWETPKGVNVSDHYGLDATLEIIRLVPAAVEPTTER
jgi:hypothetical protein